MKAGSAPNGFNKFFNNQYHWFMVLTVVIVLALGGGLLLWPQYQQLQERGVWQYDQAKALLAEREQYLSKLQSMQKQYDELHFRAWRSLEYILPSQTDIYLLFAQIEALARQSNFNVTSIVINDVAATAGSNNTATTVQKQLAGVKPEATLPSGVQKISVTLNIQGGATYADFKKMLDALEKNVQLIDINSLGYSPNKQSYTVTFNTYYLGK